MTDKLDDWLDKHNARHFWNAPVRGVGIITAYQVGNCVVYVMRYTMPPGSSRQDWDIFVPPSPNDSDRARVLEATERVLGIEAKPGDPSP